MSADRLLEKVFYISRPPEVYHTQDGHNIKCLPTLAATSKNTSKPQWRARRSSLHAGFCPIPQCVENKPVKLTIVGLDARRGTGKKYYKVIDQKSRLFDLCEDQLLDAICVTGIEPGGKINGEFQWGIQNHKTKLVLVGSALHKRMQANLDDYLADRNMENTGAVIKPSDAVPGTIYRRNNKYILYVGTCMMKGKGKSHILVDVPEPTKPPWWFWQVSPTEGADWKDLTWDDRLTFWHIFLSGEKNGYTHMSTQKYFKSFHEEIVKIKFNDYFRKEQRNFEFPSGHGEEYEKIVPRPIVGYHAWRKRARKWYFDSITWLN